ncbi:MAG: DUF6596 domain-containing protein [Pseudomonadota bacterium]
MTEAAPQPMPVEHALSAVLRRDRGRLMAALIARLRDFQLAEDALQEASLSALTHWGRTGLPQSPQGWLLRVALRKAIDRLRLATRSDRTAAELARLGVSEADETDPDLIPDVRLRLIFTCCHPALDAKSRVALTLRSVAGLTTVEIAAAFLDEAATMGQRLSRAKAKIAAAGIPFAVPEADEMATRLQSVLTVVYLIFTTGYTNGPGQDRDLCIEAIFLARLLDQLGPGQAEVEGCLALLLITHARRAARVGGAGTIALADQDRSLWDLAAITDGLALLDCAMQRRTPGPFQIKAAIAACHVQAATPDWRQIAMLYDALLRMEPTPVVRLNRAVAYAEAVGPEAGLAALLPLMVDLDGFQPFHAAHADLLARTGRVVESKAAYARAILLATNPADAAFLSLRLQNLPN